MNDSKNNLEGAYALATPAANRRFYDDWAGTYDAEFANLRGYLIPAALARVFARAATPDDTPVLDIGAGTGLVAEALHGHGEWTIDALDISPQMLEAARAKGRYRHYLTADLTRKSQLEDASFSAAISAGTFTHGHLGPDALHEVLRLLRPGALVVIAINQRHFAAAGFDTKFAALKNAITLPVFHRANIYSRRTKDGHDDDAALITTFRKRL